jgi:hypothetical protein
MIIEIMAALFLIFLMWGFSVIARLIGRRRDVLYHLSKPDSRR